MDVPVLPVNDAAVDLKRYTLRLSDVDGLNIFSEASFGLDGSRRIVTRGSFVDRSPHRRDINVVDLLRRGIEDRCEIKREGILAVIRMRPVVHQGLLESNGTSETVVITNSPRC